MALMTKRCSVSQAPVTLITDFEGTVSRVICPGGDMPFPSPRVRPSTSPQISCRSLFSRSSPIAQV